jgi:hypothetical protein
MSDYQAGIQKVEIQGTPNVGVTFPAEMEIKNDSGAALATKSADGDFATIGAKADTPVTDPTLQASQIALLKGLIKQLQGTGPVPSAVSLTGSNPADGITNPPVPLMVYNGSTWDKLRTVNTMPGWNTVSGSGMKGSIVNVPYISNGTTFDVQQGNTQGTLLASQARTATAQSPTQTNYNARGILIHLNVTVASGTGGLQLRVYSIDPVSGGVKPINNLPTAVTATGVYTYVIYPGISADANTQVSASILPRTFNVTVSAGDSTSYTYSVGYSLIL